MIADRQLAPAYALWVGVLAIVLRACLLDTSAGEPRVRAFDALPLTILAAMVLPGPAMLTRREVRTALRVLSGAAASVALVVAAVIAVYATSLTGHAMLSDDVTRVTSDYLRDRNVAGAAAIGSGLGALLALCVVSRGRCGSCNKHVRAWQVAHRCARRACVDATASAFHGKCLVGIHDEDLVRADRDGLDRLERVSRGTWFPPPKARSMCQLCAKAIARAALDAHCVHGAFLVPRASLAQQEVACAHCGEAAAAGPHDERSHRIAIFDGSGETIVPRYSLGPLVACPHCSTPHHLLCWRANAGCKNAGRPDGEGRVCHMRSDRLRRRVLFEAGWPEVCGPCAEPAGWKLDGPSHRAIALTRVYAARGSA